MAEDPAIAPIRPSALLAVAVGGAAGAPLRYGIGRWVHVARHGFPVGTFAINVSGSFALGVVLVVVLERFPGPRAQLVRSLVATGFLGAYTTFSTFAVDTDLLVKDHREDVAVAYVAASLLAGLVAAAAGIAVTRAFFPRRRGAALPRRRGAAPC